MQNRIKELRKNRHLTQAELGVIISVTQQNLSKYENGVYEIPSDVLIKISRYFNVSLEYILCLTETKRDLEGQLLVNRTLEEHHDFIESYKELSESNKELIWTIVEKMKQLSRKE